jgi:hypothetical protein
MYREDVCIQNMYGIICVWIDEGEDIFTEYINEGGALSYLH